MLTLILFVNIYSEIEMESWKKIFLGVIGDFLGNKGSDLEWSQDTHTRIFKFMLLILLSYLKSKHF